MPYWYIFSRNFFFFPVAMINNGTAGASSVYNDDVYSQPKYAFQNSRNYWLSKYGLPQSVWMRFPTPRRLVKIGFSSVRNNAAPQRFDVVGSSNCTDERTSGGPWTSLLRVDDAGFPDDSAGRLFKSWIVPEGNRRPFLCLGLKVVSIWDVVNPSVTLKNIVMWE